MMGRLWSSLALILLFVPVCARAHDCVNLFESKKGLFNVCETNECFIFRTEVPFVFMDPWMNATEHQKPFRCRDRAQNFSELTGPFFDIVDKVEPLRDAYCVWGGSNCTFDDKIKFVSRNAKTHRFIAGGLLFMLEYRISIDTIPSAPLMEDKLILIGPRDDDRAGWKSAWIALWRPFTDSAWIMLAFTFIFIVVIRVWISWFFTRPFNWHHFRDNMLGDYHHHRYIQRNASSTQGSQQPRTAAGRPQQSSSSFPFSSSSTLNLNRYHHHHPLRIDPPARAPQQAARHSDPAELRRLNMYLANGAKLLFVIVVLYYEISVVDWVFEDRRENVDYINPKEFAITKNSTMDRIFIDHFKAVDTRSAARCTPPCWKQVSNISKVYETVTDVRGDNQHRYSAVYEVFNRYWFKSNNSLCQSLHVLEYTPLIRSFSGVWYYSSAIPQDRRTEIDKAIVALREQGEIMKIIHTKTGSELPPKCESSTSISVLLLFVPLVCFPGPIFAAVFFYMVLYTIRRRGILSENTSTLPTSPRADREDIRDADEPYFSTVSASADSSAGSSTVDLLERGKFQSRLGVG